MITITPKKAKIEKILDDAALDSLPKKQVRKISNKVERVKNKVLKTLGSLVSLKI